MTRFARLPVAILAVAAAAASTSCTIGAPPGFSSGDSWSFPLVGALEGGQLLAPVVIQGQGPYLFLIDPDAPVSILDGALANELDLHTAIGPTLVDETDTLRTTKTAEVLRIQLGNLTVKNRVFMMSDVGTYNVAGRQVRGVIGRDVLADSLVFGFDRDRGMGYVATQQGFTPGAGATRLGYELRKIRIESGIRPVSRRLVHARVGGADVVLHVDLGEIPSQLREKKWSAAGLAPIAVTRALVDEAGTRREVDHGAVASDVAVDGVAARDVLFVPFADKRWDETDYDGTLGLGFFADDTVWINFDKNALYVEPRSTEDLTRARIDRWGAAALSACTDPACTRAEMLVPEPQPPEPPAGGTVDAPPADPTGADAAAKPVPPPPPPPPPSKRGAPPLLHVERDASVADVAFEVLLEARAASGAPAGLPLIVAEFPPGTTQVTQKVDAPYVGTTFKVLDVSPFVRTCPHEGACVYQLSAAK
ncbi:MAG: aspartyl protease family protein [Kofleriaceae bacterium]|nr:aspartyl protease family protein [Myxococcales bacterium]MCB9561468.1 aspartyl protease family protein [Kofleriaceae bacterium]MCB9573522.1 aspartyl protease family protein [Kofleriaceae bacterium]